MSKDYIDCTTIMMGKYVENLEGEHEYESELVTAKHFAEAFALWVEFEFFDEKSNWLIIKISFNNDHFFKEELLSAIKFFMQFHDYSYIKTINEQKSDD